MKAKKPTSPKVARNSDPVVSVPALWSNPWLLFAFALTAAFIVFSPSLHGTFIFDDFNLPFAAPRAAEMPARFWIGGVRPLLSATYWGNFLLSGADPFSYHVVNVILHALTGFLVYLIFKILFRLSESVGNNSFSAVSAAAIFLLHPLQTESVDYIAGRSELMSGLFFCAAWLVFLRNFEAATSWLTSLSILTLAGAAILAKENAICLPAVLLASDFFWRKESVGIQLRKRAKLYAPLALGGAAAALWILRGLSQNSGVGSSSVTASLQYAVTQCRVILIYVRLFLLPSGQNGDWQLPLFRSLSDSGAWIYVLMMLALIAAIVRFSVRFRVVSFGVLIFLLMLAPTSSLVPIKDVLAERRMYMPVIGLIFALVATLDGLNMGASRLRATVLGLLLVLAGLSWQRSGVWRGPLEYWGDSVRKNPANSRAHFGLGSALVAAGNCHGAAAEFKLARASDPSNDQIAWDLAAALQCDRQPAMALPLLQAFAKTHPTADAWNQIAITQASLGNVDAVLAAVENALRADPNNANSYAYRGLARTALDNIAGAKADFQHALRLDPGNALALEGLRRIPAPK